MRLPLFAAGSAALFAVACQQAETPPSSAEVNGTTPTAFAQTIRDRQGHFKQMGPAMKAIGDQLKAPSPDIAAIRQRTAVLASYGPQLGTWFEQGSGPESGERTRALAAIWSDPDGFRAAAAEYENAATAAHQAAQASDLAALRPAVGALGKSCTNCHERFRGPEAD